MTQPKTDTNTTDGATPPLWRVMEAAFLDGRSPGFSDCLGYAAELRAVGRFIEMNRDKMEISLDDAFRVAGVLYAEAQRAEAGE